MKRKMLLTWFVLVLATALPAQIVFLDDDEGAPRALASGEEVPFIPLLGVTHDQYAPLPDGVLLLCLFAGGVLKRKRNGKALNEVK